MNAFNKLLLRGSVVLLGISAAYGHDSRYQPVPQLQGVWLTQVFIRDCVSGANLAGPFAGILSFQSGGTVSETGPSLPNSTRGAGYGTWWRTGRTTFAQALTFQRFDVTGIYLGTQVIRGTPKVSNDSMSFVAEGGSFEVKDTRGTTLGAPGCSYATGARFR
ncbi:MAG: hypothetical protein WDO72_07745 [Pseudomonadota bacterium]